MSRSVGVWVAAAAAAITTGSGLPAAVAQEPASAQGVLLIAHRGDAGHAPEHTLAAIDQAVAAHADRLSIDVNLTKDGVPVVIHDYYLSRTTNVEEVFPTRSPWPVSAFTLAEIRELDAGSWYPGGAYTGSRVLTLDEVLTELAGSPTGLTVEAKNPSLQGGVTGIGRAIMGVLAAHPEWSSANPDGSPRLVLESFDWQFLDAMHGAYPDLPLVLLGDVTDADMRARPYAREVDVRYAALTPAVVAAAKDHGMLAGTWTPNTESDLQGAIDDGADAVTTDQPELLRDLLAQRGKTWTGTSWPAPAPVVEVRLDGPGEALLDGRLALRAHLVAADGSPVRWQPVRFQTWHGNGWVDASANASDATGTAAASLPPSSQGTQVRAVSGDAVSQVYLVPAARRQTSRLALFGPASVRDGRSAMLTVQWRSEDGQPVNGPVDVYASTGGGWSKVARVSTDAAVARLQVRPAASTTYEARAGSGPWWTAPSAARVRVLNRPAGPVVTPPPGAPQPSRRLTQPRVWTTGAHPRVTRLSRAAWARMSGRLWRPGCPVGRAGLRTLHVSYWGFDGYRHRGEVVVAQRSASRLGRVFADLYRGRRPLRSLRGPESLGTYRTAVRTALRADDSFGFACQRLPGDTARVGSHARGTVVSINPWENPTRLGGRGVPDSWWLPRGRSLDYVHSAGGPVVRAFAAHGFAWNGRSGRYAEFRDVR